MFLVPKFPCEKAHGKLVLQNVNLSPSSTPMKEKKKKTKVPRASKKDLLQYDRSKVQTYEVFHWKKNQWLVSLPAHIKQPKD